jgi:hypothetical protein
MFRTSFHRNQVRSFWFLETPGGSKDLCDNLFTFVCLINCDTVWSRHEVEAKEGPNQTKDMNLPFSPELRNNVFIRRCSSFSSAEKVVGRSAEDDGFVINDAGADTWIRSIG